MSDNDFPLSEMQDILRKSLEPDKIYSPDWKKSEFVGFEGTNDYKELANIVKKLDADKENNAFYNALIKTHDNFFRALDAGEFDLLKERAKSSDDLDEAGRRALYGDWQRYISWKKDEVIRDFKTYLIERDFYKNKSEELRNQFYDDWKSLVLLGKRKVFKYSQWMEVNGGISSSRDDIYDFIGFVNECYEDCLSTRTATTKTSLMAGNRRHTASKKALAKG
ncbi:Uncharacterised protein [uncultured archaeon]|nr:Uncharacterised protein [uncultured archaeon]